MTKGETTRNLILEHAVALTRRVGLEGLTIGTLAKAVDMTKSGVYAHFDSKEALQMAVLAAARERFVQSVVVPALRGPRGVPQLRALFEGWLAWGLGDDLAGGCPFVGAAAEFDDRPGPVREALVAHQSDLVGLLESSAIGAVREGEFRESLDPTAFAQDTYAIILGCYHFQGLLEIPDTMDRARAAFERLLASAAV